MQVWRLCKQKHQDTAFSGEGGLYASGRWHPKGFPIVYTASSLALATLEVFVHTESNQIPLVAIRAYFSDDLLIEIVKIEDLPANWQEVSAYPSLQQIGRQWLALVSSSWRLEKLQYKRFNKASEFEANPPKLTLFQGYRGLQQELF